MPASDRALETAIRRRNVYDATMQAMDAGAIEVKLDAFGEKLDALGRRMDERFEQVDKRFEQVEMRLEKLEGRFDRLQLTMLAGALGIIATLIGFN